MFVLFRMEIPIVEYGDHTLSVDSHVDLVTRKHVIELSCSSCHAKITSSIIYHELMDNESPGLFLDRSVLHFKRRYPPSCSDTVALKIHES